jgi:hypothetical protein
MIYHNPFLYVLLGAHVHVFLLLSPSTDFKLFGKSENHGGSSSSIVLFQIQNQFKEKSTKVGKPFSNDYLPGTTE